jgi:acetyl/propionyl-CoA carboxylase alpha subunit
MIRKLLVVNRGEIAVRVIRAARELGIATVAVYSEADAHQAHVQMADEAVCLGASEPSASYLRIEGVIDACQTVGADAVHPGYGFLSERAEFAEALAEAGITFIGPPPAAMRALGGKIEAKQIAVGAGVPVTPGFFEQGATSAQLKQAAIDIGFPVMLKASAGGGGRGMRIVRSVDEFDAELAIASDEALKGFGDGTMMVEKLIERPRHVELQLLADQHGNVAAVFERECSIQRRHQKLLEEAPAPAFDRFPDLWPQMREASIALAKAAGYVGAGTVEFMVDDSEGKFYFLEVNARLQVEHPVTELITGLDLVQWQIRIAEGAKLELPPDLMAGNRSALNGHAIEARIVAEDPAAGFLPSVGRILAWAEPRGPGIRVDTGYGPRAEVPRYYDSLLAKVIAHGTTRADAIRRLKAALLDFHILGVKTNIAYLIEVLDHPGFQAGEIDTTFLGREFAEWQLPTGWPPELADIADAATHGAASSTMGRAQTASITMPAWSLNDGFRNARP